MIGLYAASNAQRCYQILMQFHPYRVARVHSWASDPGVIALFDSCEGSREAGVVSPESYEAPAELLEQPFVSDDDDLLHAGAELVILSPVEARILRPREPEAHKGTHGHLAVIAGSLAKTGAAILSARAATRARSYWLRPTRISFSSTMAT